MNRVSKFIAYRGDETPIISVGGKTSQGFVVSTHYDGERKSDAFVARLADGPLYHIADIRRGEWNEIAITLTRGNAKIAINNHETMLPVKDILRKLAFGGLYEPVQWANYSEQAMFFHLDISSIVIEHD